MENGDIFTYLPLDLEISPSDLARFAAEVESVPMEQWFWSPYRTCNMLALFTGGSKMDRFSISDHDRSFEWTAAGMKTDGLREFLTREVFPWMSPPGRVVILKTPPGQAIRMHTDCSFEDRDKLQYKFRIVLKGERDNLWFLGEDGQKHRIDGRHSTYILDGSHPHGMDNGGDTEKLTLCVGAPWGDFNFAPFIDLVQRSFASNGSSSIARSVIGRPVYPEIFQARPE